MICTYRSRASIHTQCNVRAWPPQEQAWMSNRATDLLAPAGMTCDAAPTCPFRHVFPELFTFSHFPLPLFICSSFFSNI